MRKALVVTLIIVSSVFISISCSKSSDSGGGASVDCNTVANKSFHTDVSPIIMSFCNVPGCHAAGSINGPGPLTNYTEVFDARTAIRSAVSTGRMPKTGTLSASQKNSITCWIDSGAPNN